MSARRFSTPIALTLALLLTACAQGRPLTDPFHQSAPSARGVKIYVTNLNFNQITVYGVTTGSRQRLGIVEGKGEAVFTMPLTYSTQIYLEVDFLAGPTCVTDRLPADPGDELEVTIQNNGANLYCRVPLRNDEGGSGTSPEPPQRQNPALSVGLSQFFGRLQPPSTGARTSSRVGLPST